ncbi:hypothetical protein [Thermogymnomonas acidicola]|uniref:hypothetical protein n=1 Tax=Thermogymnomonas acidicola TaxID=399579 RepID=UPI0014947F05|nr:hypothetical protein [Thermogymnomonas acidicola]
MVGSDYKSVLQSLKKKGLIYTRRYRNSERVRLTKAFYERFEIKEQQGEGGKDVS